MDPVTIFVTNVAAGMLANFAADGVTALFRKALELRPSLGEIMQSASTLDDVENIFREAVGVIDAQAGTGNVQVDGALLTALRGARFNHAQGTVYIGDSWIQAPVLVTGGQSGATGTTIIEGNTSLKSAGTEIKMTKGAKIEMTGNAKITQT